MQMKTGFSWSPFLLLMSAAIFAQSSNVFVTGRVRDDRGRALPFVNVQIVDSFEGGASDHAGRFIFATRKQGEARARATCVGYETAEHSFRLDPGDTVRVDFVLHETIIKLKEAVVTASAFVTGDEGKGVTLRRMEIVTTPGAAADIFLAIKTFPGVAMVDEGSGLFVRGGDVSETVTLLDQATVVHPYKYESPTGGVFGTISPFRVGPLSSIPAAVPVQSGKWQSRADVAGCATFHSRPRAPKANHPHSRGGFLQAISTFDCRGFRATLFQSRRRVRARLRSFLQIRCILANTAEWLAVL